DLVDKSAGSQNIGRNNVFQYRQASAPPGSSKNRSGTSEPPETAPTASTSTPPVLSRPQPPAPPPLPPIPFKYQGFAIIAANNTLTAFLSDDSSRHYNVTAGEILMGRYRIVQVSDKSVEVEDVENSRRQTLPLVK